MNNYFIFKKTIAIVLLCCMMLSGGGCSIMMIPGGVAVYFDKNNKSSYKKESELLFITALGVSLDYIWYSSAQLYQRQGSDKISSYAGATAVVAGVVFGLAVLARALTLYYKNNN